MASVGGALASVVPGAEPRAPHSFSLGPEGLDFSSHSVSPWAVL